MSKDSIGDRMKHYENCYRHVFPRRIPLIARIDGRSFHSYTKGLERPIDLKFVDAMNQTAIYVASNLAGTQLAYIQSDEISFLITNDQEYDTKPVFDNKQSKLESVIAGMASAFFSNLSPNLFGKFKLATFDCRVTPYTKEEVNNCFQWRQLDCRRNSISTLAQVHFKPAQLHGKHADEMKEMLKLKRIDWEQAPLFQQRGRCAIKKWETKTRQQNGETIEFQRKTWHIDNEIPIFSQKKDYIESLLVKETL
jgi:tRNA(His) guanylyltransferase